MIDHFDVIEGAAALPGQAPVEDEDLPRDEGSEREEVKDLAEEAVEAVSVFDPDFVPESESCVHLDRLKWG